LLAEIGAASTALFLTGGDTARAVLSRLGIGSIEVVGTLYPGVVRGEASLGGERLSVITKAGGFGNVDLFPRVAQDLLQR
jgi:4-hydroxythreonine-4-phosphate dehydrogenase